MAEDAQTWLDLPLDEVPEGLERSGAWVSIGVAEHYEQGGHTWYRLDVALATPGARTRSWQVVRRLSQLRVTWHDRTKAALGEEYRNVFGKVPFAGRGGRRGTTAKLHRWCERLAASINAGLVPPAVVALTLQFLEASNVAASEGKGETPEDCISAVSTRCGSEAEGGSSGNSPRLEDEDDCYSDESYESDFDSESESESEEEEA